MNKFHLRETTRSIEVNDKEIRTKVYEQKNKTYIIGMNKIIREKIRKSEK